VIIIFIVVELWICVFILDDGVLLLVVVERVVTLDSATVVQ
jgi:hypothetical protein